MRSGRSILACLTTLCGILAVLFFTGDSIYTELTFSRESGFYEEPFDLEIYAPPGTQIFYTLDGSDPDENALLYTGPIRIEDATNHDNIYSMRTDISAGYLSEMIAVYSVSDPKYVSPNYNVDKCTVVRSIYRDADGNFSEIKTESYYVGYEKKKGYDDINIISIVSDPDSLFGYENGIYVLGQEFEECINDNSEHSPENDPCWWFWNANYTQRGPDWERDANIQLFDTEKNLLLNKDCGIRIQGGGSRGSIPRSLNLYAREQYDGEGRFYIDLFNTNYMADTVTLFAGGDDSVAKLRDMLASGLLADRNFSTMNYVPCAMFLDGEYWGIYWLTEKYDDVYLAHYYNVDKDNLIMMKGTAAAEGEEYYQLFDQMQNYLKNSDLSIDENYRYACELIDMQSYIDYYASEIFIGRENDWPILNEAMWRVCEPCDGEYEDGKWRWMLYDVNSSALASSLTGNDTFSSTMDRSQIFYNLCRNEDFKRQFAITFMDLVNTSFTRENIDAVISEYIDLMEDPIGIHRKRFYGTANSNEFIDEVSDIQDFLDHRKPYIVQYMKDAFGLTGTLASVELEINDTASGNVILNTIVPSFDDEGKWSGEYYTDYPITLTASANDGYSFLRWESDALSENERMDETVELPVSEKNVTIKAVFTPSSYEYP